MRVWNWRFTMEHQVMAALIRASAAAGRGSGWGWFPAHPRAACHAGVPRSRRGALCRAADRAHLRSIEAPTDGAAVAEGTARQILEASWKWTPIWLPSRRCSARKSKGRLADWRRAANMLGIHLEAADAIGLGPVLYLSNDPEILS
jgi:hypothetical protein